MPAYLDEEANGDEYGEDKHSTQTVEVECATSGPIHEGNWHQSHNNHNRAHSQGGILGLPLFQARRREQGRRIVQNLPD